MENIGENYGYGSGVDVCTGVSVRSGSFTCSTNRGYLGKPENQELQSPIIYFSADKPSKISFGDPFVTPFIIQQLPTFFNYVVVPACQKASENLAVILLGAVLLVAGGVILTEAIENENEVTFDYEQIQESNGAFTNFEQHYQKHVVDQHEYDNIIAYSPGSKQSKDNYRDGCKKSANKSIGEVRKFFRQIDKEIIIWDPSIEQVVFMNSRGDIDSCFIPNSTKYSPRFKYIQKMIDSGEIIEIIPK